MDCGYSTTERKSAESNDKDDQETLEGSSSSGNGGVTQRGSEVPQLPISDEATKNRTYNLIEAIKRRVRTENINRTQPMRPYWLKEEEELLELLYQHDMTFEQIASVGVHGSDCNAVTLAKDSSQKLI